MLQNVRGAQEIGIELEQHLQISFRIPVHPRKSAVSLFNDISSIAALHFLFYPGAHMPLPEYKQLVDEAKREIKEITPEDLKAMQQKKENFTLIDVREPDEVAAGAIAGSKPLPRGQLEHKIDTITTDKDQPIVCYCGGGGRSALAAQSLKKMGFKNVMSLAGGYKGWKE